MYKDRIFKTFNDFLDKFQNYQSQWDFHFEKFGCTIYDIYSPFASNRNDLKDELLLSIDRILTEYTSTPPKDNHSLYFTHTKVIIPIKKLCRASRNNKYSTQLLPTIDFLEKTYNNIVYIQKFYSETVNNEKENLIQNHKLLKEAIDYFKKVYKFQP